MLVNFIVPTWFYWAPTSVNIRQSSGVQLAPVSEIFEIFGEMWSSFYYYYYYQYLKEEGEKNDSKWQMKWKIFALGKKNRRKGGTRGKW